MHKYTTQLTIKSPSEFNNLVWGDWFLDKTTTGLSLFV